MVDEKVSAMDFSKDIADIKVAVQRIESTMVPRSEIETNLKDRVTMDVYQANHNALIERVIRIETNPQRMIAWVSTGIGCLSMLIAAAGVTFTVIVFLITHK
jgi:hypothetical protein